ncbi:hypothetical protein K505DRAFT_197096, partial [Melanomma pulvis-pyrius CBS 109.77]
MTPAFGFSVGDFIAGLSLLHKVVAALREADGAKSQYSHTILELEGLQNLLRTVQSFQPTDSTSENAEKLRILGHQCYLPLAAFLKKIEKFECALGSKTSGRK